MSKLFNYFLKKKKHEKTNFFKIFKKRPEQNSIRYNSL